MVYNKKFVAAVKCNGKILREYKDVVYIPFGSEYSILLKNLNSRPALVDVTVDGREVVSNLIVRSNDSVEVERFFEGDMISGHALKFIEKNNDIREFRGDRIEDGIVKIAYRFEKQRPWYIYNTTWVGKTTYNDSDWYSYNINHDNTKLYRSLTSESYAPASYAFNNVNKSLNEDGITVEGRQSNQQFSHGHIGLLEDETYVIVLQLKGETEKNQPVVDPIRVKDKIRCKYCGKRWRSDMKFCANCGAALI